jgi:hypothetical protein
LGFSFGKETSKKFGNFFAHFTQNHEVCRSFFCSPAQSCTGLTAVVESKNARMDGNVCTLPIHHMHCQRECSAAETLLPSLTNRLQGFLTRKVQTEAEQMQVLSPTDMIVRVVVVGLLSWCGDCDGCKRAHHLSLPLSLFSCNSEM